MVPRTVRAHEAVMGTVVTFEIAFHADEREPSIALARARLVLRRADAVFSLWKPESPMSRIRRGDLAVDDAPRDVAEVLAICRMARDATEGWFDAEALPGGIDPTGIVKGWAAQRALDVLVGEGFADVLVNAGGDVVGAGSPAEGERWRVGIQHPDARDRLLGVVELSGACATSGTYERGAHLFDPRSRRYRAAARTATVTGPDLALADGCATALAVAGEAGLAFLEAMPGYAGCVLTDSGILRATSSFRFATADGMST